MTPLIISKLFASFAGAAMCGAMALYAILAVRMARKYRDTDELWWGLVAPAALMFALTLGLAAMWAWGMSVVWGA